MKLQIGDYMGRGEKYYVWAESRHITEYLSTDGRMCGDGRYGYLYYNSKKATKRAIKAWKKKNRATSKSQS